jgi:hypothetical protein
LLAQANDRPRPATRQTPHRPPVEARFASPHGMSLLLDLHSKGWQSRLTDVTSPRFAHGLSGDREISGRGGRGFRQGRAAHSGSPERRVPHRLALCGSDGGPGRRSRIWGSGALSRRRAARRLLLDQADSQRHGALARGRQRIGASRSPKTACHYCRIGTAGVTPPDAATAARPPRRCSTLTPETGRVGSTVSQVHAGCN